jgi:hypothetical protein
MESDWRSLLGAYSKEANCTMEVISDSLERLQSQKQKIIEAIKDVPLSEVFQEDDTNGLARIEVYTLGELIESLRYSSSSFTGQGICISSIKTKSIIIAGHPVMARVQVVLTGLGSGFLFDKKVVEQLLGNLQEELKDIF